MAKSSRRSAQSADNRMKKPQNRTGPAKPKAAFDLAGVAKLAVIQSTDQEIFDWFHGTIPRRILESKRFRQAIERGRSRGRVSLRRLQFEAAQRHDPAMLRLLGEQWLGQKQMVGVQGGGPRKKLLPGWLTKKGEGYEEELPDQDFDDRATGNGGVQRSTLAESALDQSTKEGEEPLAA